MAKMEKDVLRNQVNQARRAGYSDDQIIQFLSSRDERIGRALQQGYAPADVLNFLAPKQTGMETAERMVGAAGRGAAPTAVATSVGTALGGPFGAVLGSLAYPATDALVQAANVALPENMQLPMPSTEAMKLLDRFGIGTPPETRGERMAQAGGEALVSTGASVVPRAAGAKLPGATGALVEEIGKAPLAQMITAPISASGSLGVGEATGNPLAALLTGAAPGVAAGIRPRLRGTDATPESMDARISEAYGKARSAGVQVPIDDYANRGFQLDSKLRQAGWRPDSDSLKDITSMLENLKSQSGTKDLQELMNIRAQIKSSASFKDPEAYRIMKIMLDDFDEYLDNIPSGQIQAVQGEEGLKAWRMGRDLFNKQRKAEVFDDILNNMEFQNTKFTMSGAENYLAGKLRNLVTNKDKMKLFTKGEQDAIKAAAKGGSVQNILRYIGKFAPTGVIPALSGVGLTAVDPMFATIPAAGAAGRLGAEQLRIGDVQRLADMMRTGRPQPGVTSLMPTTFSRGLLSTELFEEQ
jgi:hypothetical protein